MCIVTFAWQSHPRWKLIAIGNRDEMHARPAAPLSRWDNPAHLLAGRDTKAGGTWLGVSEEGRFAVVTNLSGYGAPDSGKSSRGDLLKDFLSGEGSYSDFSVSEFEDFNPFNLITISGDQALIHSNQPEPVSGALTADIYDLSNGPLERPWPKSGTLKMSLKTWMNGSAENPEHLLNALQDETPYFPQGEAENYAKDDLARHPQYSPIFIRNPVYGTRCSTVVVIDHEGDGLIIERRFASSAEITGQTALTFSWPV
ncbi:NRDE family protein [Parasphingorhabdus cellanae]|uniref:NRDE family protein n=1 Tax=Parasphingorhabdus cellanae TaxID=2806553 RepID=A0ABX7T109_9SPHN|nr:NRDE family protein [Parasphingorhabdus cellanae]QTD55236.1 NRDE family protein [Parasphingorhabdus cellanae]